MVAIAHTYDVFISYSHKDQAWVDSQLMPRLEGAGLHVAIDYRDFPLGRIAQQNMEQAVDSSRRVVLVMSPNWLQSQWSGFEVLLRQCGGSDRAAGKLVPILIAPTELPRRYSFITYADLTNPATYEREMARVIAALQPGTAADDPGSARSVPPAPTPIPQPPATPVPAAWQPELADLFVRSGRAQASARRAMCIEIGVDADSISFMDAAPRDFAVQLVDLLDKTGNIDALLALCAALQSVLKGAFANRLQAVTGSVRRSQPG